MMRKKCVPRGIGVRLKAGAVDRDATQGALAPVSKRAGRPGLFSSKRQIELLDSFRRPRLASELRGKSRQGKTRLGETPSTCFSHPGIKFLLELSAMDFR
ncbi:MAG: hypothetical protein M0Q93_02085 [Terrimicrobiaceae bacterium]|jgi:hypothetical protein|nr:hypothetical protein [Terrimicrobiaceae bacterium]